MSCALVLAWLSAGNRMRERFYEAFEAVYQERYRFWRPINGTVGRKFLECGDLKHGFARVRCPKCREEFFVPYSCRGRCFCPSCHQKRALEKAGKVWMQEHAGWTRQAGKGWIVYLMAGHSGKDFENPVYSRTVINSVVWKP